MTTYLINACHSIAGGGLRYLQNILPSFYEDPGYWIIAAQQETLGQIEVPAHWTVWKAPNRGIQLHLWEQIVLPFKMSHAGINVCYCNANYIPLFGPRSCQFIPMLHTDTSLGRKPRMDELVERPGWRDDFAKAVFEYKEKRAYKILKNVAATRMSIEW